MNNNQHIEMALLTKVILEKDFHALEKAQITEEFFVNEIAKEVFRYLRSLYRAPDTAGSVPSMEMVQYKFPNSFYPFPSSDSVQVLASELRREKVRLELLTLSQRIQVVAETDPMEGMAILRADSAKISSLAEAGQDLMMSGVSRFLRNQYDTIQQAGGITGLPYPWSPINVETQGILPGQFIVLYGRPKSMKTWVAVYMACHIYMEARRRVLYYTREMHPNLIAQRMAACINAVDYGAFKKGTLQPHLKEKVFRTLEELGESDLSVKKYLGNREPFIRIVSDRGRNSGSGGGGVGWLQAKIKETSPDIVFVDGMYLMKDDRTNQRTIDWKQIAHISQDLKGVAQDEEIPLVGITQANRASEKTKGEDLTELAYADAIGQDADGVFRVRKVDKIDEHTKNLVTELHITAPGLREAKLDGIVVHGEPATDFRWIRNIVHLDMQDDDYQQSKKGQFAKGVPFTDPRLPPRFMSAK